MFTLANGMAAVPWSIAAWPVACPNQPLVFWTVQPWRLLGAKTLSRRQLLVMTNTDERMTFYNVLQCPTGTDGRKTVVAGWPPREPRSAPPKRRIP